MLVAPCGIGMWQWMAVLGLEPSFCCACGVPLQDVGELIVEVLEVLGFLFQIATGVGECKVEVCIGHHKGSVGRFFLRLCFALLF